MQHLAPASVQMCSFTSELLSQWCSTSHGPADVGEIFTLSFGLCGGVFIIVSPEVVLSFDSVRPPLAITAVYVRSWLMFG